MNWKTLVKYRSLFNLSELRKRLLSKGFLETKPITVDPAVDGSVGGASGREERKATRP